MARKSGVETETVTDVNRFMCAVNMAFSRFLQLSLNGIANFSATFAHETISRRQRVIIVLSSCQKEERVVQGPLNLPDHNSSHL